jgi:hypothetical protein
MGARNEVWRETLEEFENEVSFWSQFSLPPAPLAKHFAPWERAVADSGLVTSGALNKPHKHYYPYVEGLE